MRDTREYYAMNRKVYAILDAGLPVNKLHLTEGVQDQDGHGLWMSILNDCGDLRSQIKLIKDDIAPGTGVDKEQNFGVFGKLILRNVPRTSDSTA